MQNILYLWWDFLYKTGVSPYSPELRIFVRTMLKFGYTKVTK